MVPILPKGRLINHYNDVTMSLMASQITSLTIVYSTVYSGADQRKHQSSASLAFVCAGNSPEPVNSSHKWPVTRKMFPFDDVIMSSGYWSLVQNIAPSQDRFTIYTHSDTFAQTMLMLIFLLIAVTHLKSPATPLFVWQLLQATNKENIKCPHCLLYVREIHRWPCP